MSDGHRLGMLTSLAFARSTTFPDDAHATYLNLLSDISDDDLLQTCRELGQRPRENFEAAMPSVGEIRRHTLSRAKRLDEEEQTRRILRVAASDDQEPRYRCATCRDTGWQEFKCPGFPRPKCGREQGALKCYPHPYVERCRCWVPRAMAS
jgi:hypothetical protein